MKRPLVKALLIVAPITVAVWVPSASAAGKIKLTGEVLKVSKASRGECVRPTEIALFDGSHKAGTIKITHCAATGTSLDYRGSVMLEVGKLTKSRLRFGVAFHPVPPNFTPATSGSGTVENSEGAERLRINGPDLPSEVGARFALILNQRVFPPA